MSIFHDKTLQNIAEVAAKILEGDLSTKQKQIAKISEPKHKIDAGDLAKLRAGHKPVKEEQEQIDELSKDTLKSYSNKVVDKTRTMPQGQKKQKHLAGFGKAQEKLKEEVELDEASYSAKAARAGKDIGKPGKAFAKIASGAAKRYGSEEKGKKVAGAILKKLRMKEDEEVDMSDEDIEQLLEAFEYDQEHQMSFSEMIAAYKEGGLKSLVSEEPDNEQFTKELEDQKLSMMGKKKQPHVAAASTQGVKQMPEEVEVFDANEVNGVTIETIEEDVEQLDELSPATLTERTLTEPETKEKERLVKSMKKNLAGFKERYGERGKSVMYATATARAKEKA